VDIKPVREVISDLCQNVGQSAKVILEEMKVLEDRVQEKLDKCNEERTGEALREYQGEMIQYVDKINGTAVGQLEGLRARASSVEETQAIEHALQYLADSAERWTQNIDPHGVGVSGGSVGEKK
jgi:hypothetical protein